MICTKERRSTEGHVACVIVVTANRDEVRQSSRVQFGTRQCAEVCQTTHNGPRSPTCTGLLEDCLGVSGRGNLAFPGTVRVYIIKPSVWDSSTGALTSF